MVPLSYQLTLNLSRRIFVVYKLTISTTYHYCSHNNSCLTLYCLDRILPTKQTKNKWHWFPSVPYRLRIFDILRFLLTHGQTLCRIFHIDYFYVHLSSFPCIFLHSPTTITISLNLFGVKKYGDEKGPGMTDQIAMFKKAKEFVYEKSDLEKDLSNTKTTRLYVERKAEITLKYVPTALPANLNPSYEISGIHINEEYLEEMPGGGISVQPFLNRYWRYMISHHLWWCKITRSSRNSLDQWCSGKMGIDYHNRTISQEIFWKGNRQGHQVGGWKLIPWCMAVKYLWIIFVVILIVT